MAISAPQIDVKIAINLINDIESRAELAHLNVKKYRNFLTIYGPEGKGSKRHARLALGDNAIWQLHLPSGRNDWEITRLCRPFNEMKQLLLNGYAQGLARGRDALRDLLMRDGLLS